MKVTKRYKTVKMFRTKATKMYRVACFHGWRDQFNWLKKEA